MIRRLLGDVDLGRDEMLLDMIERVGIGGDFLKEKETARRLRAGEHFTPVDLDAPGLRRVGGRRPRRGGEGAGAHGRALRRPRRARPAADRRQLAELAAVCGSRPRWPACSATERDRDSWRVPPGWIYSRPGAWASVRPRRRTGGAGRRRRSRAGRAMRPPAVAREAQWQTCRTRLSRGRSTPDFLEPPLAAVHADAGPQAGHHGARRGRARLRHATATSTSTPSPASGRSTSATAAQEIHDAIKAQMEKLAIYHIFQIANEPAIKLAAKVAEHMPGDLNHVFLTLGGGESVETAVKMARQYWRNKGKGTKYMVMFRDRSYHGTTMTSHERPGPLREPRQVRAPAARLHQARRALLLPLRLEQDLRRGLPDGVRQAGRARRSPSTAPRTWARCSARR